MNNSEETAAVRTLYAEQAWSLACSRTPSMKIIDCWENVSTIFELHPQWAGVLGFDEFSQQVVKRKAGPEGFEPGAWLADDDLRAGMWLRDVAGLTVHALATISTAVTATAKRHTFHELRDWLSGLVWDGGRRLDMWLTDFLGVEPGEYATLVGRYFLLAMVARIFEPGCIMRQVLVLEGAQEIGKSTALRVLAGEPYFSDSHLDLTSKDAFELIQGTWLYEISEMHAFNRAEATKVKQFISSQRDQWVPKYVRGKVSVPRQVVFAGSTNENLYLRDWTGNTRFWPVRAGVVDSINVPGLAEAREQLFAEAVARYRAGERRFPTPEEFAAHFEPQQAMRLIDHPWAEPIAAWLETIASTRVTVAEVLGDACKVETGKRTMMQQQDVGRILTAFGWERRREPTGLRRWFYYRPEVANSGKNAASQQNGADGGEDSTGAPF